MRVVVVGGGLAGLFTASELMHRGVEVMVLDAASGPGGITRTIARDGFSLEPAAASFTLPHPHLGPILERAEVEVEVAASGTVRHVYVRDRLVALSQSPRTLLAPLMPAPAKLRFLLEPLVRSRSPEEESLADFCRRRFGAQAGELVAWLMASGVFAGDPERLAVAAAFPMLNLLEREEGSVIRGAVRRRRGRPPGRVHLPTGGMTRLAETIAASLGERFRCDFPVGSIRGEGGRWLVEGPEQLTAEAVVLAVSPAQASSLLRGAIADHLAGAVSAPVTVVGLGAGGPSRLPSGFGALIGPGEGMVSRGVLFETSYAPARAPEGSWLVKVIAGGAPRGEVNEWDDERLIHTVSKEVERVIGEEISPEFVEVARHRQGIPQYESGHRNWLAGLDELLPEQPGLYLTGWGYRGVGVGHLAADAVRVAKSALALFGHRWS